MKALQIQKFGEPKDALKLVDLPQAPLRGGEVRVRIRAAGINPSDVVNAKGGFPSTTLPRVIGRDFAGEIVEGPAELVGAEIWGSGGDLGFTRDGSHAEMIDIPVRAVAEKPNGLSFEEAAIIGVPFTAAQVALDAARMKAGDWVIVTGAAGAVGSAATGLIQARGGHAIAFIKDASEQGLLDRDKVSAVADAGNLEAVVREVTDERGADIALNAIGASIAAALLTCLMPGGRMAVYGAAFGGHEMQLDLFKLYRRRLELIGVNTADFDSAEAAGILDRLKPLFENRLLAAPRIAERYALDQFETAYNRVSHSAGKVVFVSA